jgi:hypothetical protein
MALSSHFLVLPDNIHSITNGSSDFDYPCDYRCNATFLATGWITWIVAATSAYYDLWERYKDYESRSKEPPVLDLEMELEIVENQDR